ncbi:hypothetical protein, partial [Klebsiella pneumoniae]|uniref:hypothetical protein n=1 Tax=Klebsiella pneumoniae TaxID=573 RepID=UPI003F6E0522
SVGEISVKTGNNARNGGKNSLNRLIRCVCGKKIGPDPRNFNQRVSLGRNDLLIRTFPSFPRSRRFCNKKQGHGGRRNQTGMWYYRGGCLSLSGSGKTQVPEMRRPHSLIH